MPPSRRPNGHDESAICPVCKSSTYLNPNMIFKINPECYHRMCDSCVERIFTSGPAPCPVAGCGKTLRKNRFKVPRFEDLSIERECDIRARVGQILNHTEADFDSLRLFNDYEEWKEELIMDLVAGVNVAEHERKLREHAKENSEAIKANARHEDAIREQLKEEERLRAERSQLARLEMRRERAEEQAEREAGKREVVDQILNANADVLRVAREAERNFDRRVAAAKGRLSSTQHAAGFAHGSKISSHHSDPNNPSLSGNGTGTGFSFAGLKKAQPVAKEIIGPYDAFAGLEVQFRYYTLLDRYIHSRSEAAEKERVFRAGGYAALDFQRRAVMECHAGLGVFVEEEKA